MGNLALTRHPGQQITLRHRETGELIVVTVADVRGQTTRLLFDAPLHWRIARDDAVKGDPELEGEAV